MSFKGSRKTRTALLENSTACSSAPPLAIVQWMLQSNLLLLGYACTLATRALISEHKKSGALASGMPVPWQRTQS